MREHIEQFRAAICNAGLSPPEVIEPDGNLHRFASNGKRGDDAGWYIFHHDGIPAGAFGDWRTGTSETWRADIGRRLSPQEESAHRQRIDRMRKAREAEDAKRKREAREKAAAIWQAATPAPVDHGYLVGKGVKAHGLRVHDGALVIPMRDGEELHSLQFIACDGDKRFLTGGRMGGCYFAMGTPQHVLCIAEGYATGASIYEATGYAVAIAFTAGNLMAVARGLRTKFPDKRLILCADNDVNTPGNPGLTKAREAAQAVSGLLAVPDFGPDRPEWATDFNDLHQHAGLGAVRLNIEQAQPVADGGEPLPTPPTDEEATAPDWRAAVERLAKLPPLEYEVVRKAEAKKLGIDRLAVLDAEVRQARGETEESIAGQPLTFPDIEPWAESVNGADLLTEITALCGRFLQLPKNADTVVALWVALTYVTEAFDILPLLFITAPEKGCGKTTVLDLVERSCARALSASNITGAALFRTVELVHPTLLLDEADTFLAENEEMRGIINSGHTRSAAFVVRVVGDDYEPRRFSTWCAKAIAGIGRLPGTTEDRSLIVTMQRLAPGERVEKLRRTHQFPDLRRKLTRWADDHREGLQAARPTLPDFLSNRAADNWEPLFAIAAAAGGNWLVRANEAAQGLTGTSPVDSIGIELLRGIREAFDAEAHGRLPTARLIERLVADDTARWSEFSRGRPITSAQIAKLLSRYGITPSTVRIGSATAKGYTREQFDEAFLRYLPALPAKTAFPAVTPSQPREKQPLDEISPRHIGESVTAAEASQALDSPTMLPRDGSKTENPVPEASPWRIEL